MTQTETKKLSDYMQEGLKQTKPWHNEMLYLDRATGRYAACAVGAACFAKNRALSIDTLLYSHATVPKEAAGLFPELYEQVTYQFDLEEGPRRIRLGALIVNLNDTYNLSREKIVEIVKGLGY
jgi:hypothetical protein